MVPGCRNRASFVVEVTPTPRFTEGACSELAPWLTLGTWNVCVGHSATLADAAMARPETVLEEYDIEHDPRMYVA